MPPPDPRTFRVRLLPRITKPLFTMRGALVMVLMALLAVWLHKHAAPPDEKPIVLIPEAPLREVRAPRGFVRKPAAPPPPMLLPPALPPEEAQKRLEELGKSKQFTAPEDDMPP